MFPDGQTPGDAQRLPSGRHGLDPDFVSAHQRRRILDAMDAVAGVEGYDRATVFRVAQMARVTQRTVYEHFEGGRESVMVAAYERACDRIVDAIAVACARAEDFGGAVHAGIAAVLQTLTAAPAQARLVMVEALRLGEPIREIRSAYLSRLSALIRSAADEFGQPALPVSSIADTAMVGGLNHVIFGHVNGGRTAALPELTDDLTAVVLLRYGMDPDDVRAVTEGDGRRRRER